MTGAAGPVTPPLWCAIGPSAGDTHAALTLNRTASLRGSFTPGSNDEEWCDRRLLARIHRLTLNRLRRDRAGDAAEFMRFLFAWQHVSSTHRPTGPKGFGQRSRSLTARAGGRRVGAVHPARSRQGYEPSMLDLLLQR
jgi:ATP-dependent Lhr-like helicase